MFNDVDVIVVMDYSFVNYVREFYGRERISKCIGRYDLVVVLVMDVKEVVSVYVVRFWVFGCLLVYEDDDEVKLEKNRKNKFVLK